MSDEPPPSALQNPIRGTTIDTSEGELGLDVSQNESSASHSQTHTRVPSFSKSVIRRVEQTAAKIGSTVLGNHALSNSNSNTGPKKERGNSCSGAPAAPSSQQEQQREGSRLSASLSSADPRKFLSLNRKGKGRERDTTADNDESTVGYSRPQLYSRSSSGLKQVSMSMVEDSPFIRPRSPPPSPPQRPTLEAFRAMGSMRAGTQTLIQAIQAIPWADEPENDDEILPPIAANSDSGEEDHLELPLASSIHTIHRPIARSRRYDSPLTGFKSASGSRRVGYFSPVPSSEEEDGDVSDEDEDFEATPIEQSRLPDRISEQSDQEETAIATSEPSATGKLAPLAHSRRINMTRSASLATVRLKRRTKLAEKLKEVFGLNEINEVLAELPCWLLRSILLQGYMYLTNSHLCFFAHLPSREDQVLKSGSLTKKTQRTKRWVKHWFVLKNDVLSWYQSSSDPYFPHGVVDLRYAISCDSVQDKLFRIRTNQKIITLMADSVPSREEWVKAVRKVIFKAQNVGESVKIAIPYSVIVDVEKSTAMDFSETIEVRVLDQEGGSQKSSYDSYFFAYFHNLPAALEQIRDAVKKYKPSTQQTLGVSEVVHDTTGGRHLISAPGAIDRTTSLPVEGSLSTRTSYGLKLASLLRPFQSDNTSTTPTPTQANVYTREPDGDASRPQRIIGPSFITSPNLRTISPQLMQTSESTQSTASDKTERQSHRSASDSATSYIKVSDVPHTYPPPPSPPSELVPITTRESTNSLNSWGVGGWLRGPRRVFASSGSMVGLGGQKGVTEVVTNLSSSTRSLDQSTTDFGFSVLETKDIVEPDVLEKFRSTFAFDGKESLLGFFRGYLFRILPTYGHLYISTNYFCFKSSGPLATRTRMQLPIRDILALEKTKAYRFGHVGLVVIIKGHEELFFEFSSADRRAAFVNLLERQMEEVQTKADDRNPSIAQRDALMLEELEPSSLICDEDPRPQPDSITDDLPAVMFTSTSSTFLTFKPRQPMHFTCLTIGSRGDVQPYIALAKGLIADGHKVRIATHGEFKDWVESHGIEFGYVGGDPAELMRICVENGMFTVSFLKEGIQKFRGWIDDLLKTSWEACQGTDVLIESPSAMAGIHIAEALGIPYYRAFTMTWTRTRAYPHAFAVPDHKMGGGYNYMSYVMFDQVFWRATAGQINRWRRNTLNLPSTTLDKLEPHKVPFLYNFSPTVVPPPLDWPEWIRVTGYWFLDDAEVSASKWTPPQDLADFIDNAHKAGKKVVYIGFGSIVVSDPDVMTRCVIEAIMKAGVCAILSKGWSDRLQVKKGADLSEPEIPLPPEIYPVKSVPHDWLFKRIEAACHHGGAGTTGASLRAGIPTIIKPFFGDQFFWGDRVEALGVGSCVRKLTVDGLAEALIAATTDERQIAKAKLVGERIRSENGVSTAIESIYRDLEYARTLVKNNRQGVEEDATIRETRDDRESTGTRGRSLTFSTAFSSPRSSVDSYLDGQEEQSEDWSVISDADEKRSSRIRGDGSEQLSQSPSSKRSSLAAAVFSVLPEALQPGSPKNSNMRM